MKICRLAILLLMLFQLPVWAQPGPIYFVERDWSFRIGEAALGSTRTGCWVTKNTAPGGIRRSTLVEEVSGSRRGASSGQASLYCRLGRSRFQCFTCLSGDTQELARMNTETNPAHLLDVAMRLCLHIGSQPRGGSDAHCWAASRVYDHSR